METMIPINFTEQALARLKKVIQIHKNDAVPYIRIGVKGGGGCAGVSNFIALDESTEKDVIYRFNALDFVIEKPHLMYLVGLTIDFVETEMDKGFVFEKTENLTQEKLL